MKEYKIIYHQIEAFSIIVEAESQEEAEKIASDKWGNEGIGEEGIVEVFQKSIELLKNQKKEGEIN